MLHVIEMLLNDDKMNKLEKHKPSVPIPPFVRIVALPNDKMKLFNVH